MNVVLVIYDLYTRVSHEWWWNEGEGFYQYSTDEGDRCPDLPIDIAVVSKDDSKGKYAYNPETKQIILNESGDPNLLRVDFCTSRLSGVAPIGEETLSQIFRSRILDKFLP